jgi:hypothetical protein
LAAPLTLTRWPPPTSLLPNIYSQSLVRREKAPSTSRTTTSSSKSSNTPSTTFCSASKSSIRTCTGRTQIPSSARIHGLHQAELRHGCKIVIGYARMCLSFQSAHTINSADAIGDALKRTNTGGASNFTYFYLEPFWPSRFVQSLPLFLIYQNLTLCRSFFPPVFLCVRLQWMTWTIPKSSY